MTEKASIDDEGLVATVMLYGRAAAIKRINEIDEELSRLGDSCIKYPAIKKLVG